MIFISTNKLKVVSKLWKFEAIINLEFNFRNSHMTNSHWMISVVS